MHPLTAVTARCRASHVINSGLSRRAAVVILVVSFAFATYATPAVAASLADKQAQAAELDREVSRLEGTYGSLQERYRGALVELREAQGDARDAQKKLATARRSLRGAKSRLTERAVTIYQVGGGSNDLVGIVEAGSVEDFFARVETMQRVSDQDTDVLERVRRAKQQVERQEARLRAARDKQAKVVRRAERAKVRMGRVLDEKQAALSSVTAEIRVIMEQQRAAAAAAAAAAARESASRFRSDGTVSATGEPIVGEPSTDGDSSASTGGGGGGDGGDGGNDGGADGGASDGGSSGAESSDSGESSSEAAASVPLPPASGGAAAAASIAMGKIGANYVFGAAGPDTFDCSGLVVWAFAQAGRGGLPHSTYSLIGMGVEVPMAQAQVGDLVFTNNSGHMGIYVGGGSFVHAPRTGRTVTVESLGNYSVVAIRRI